MSKPDPKHDELDKLQRARDEMRRRNDDLAPEPEKDSEQKRPQSLEEWRDLADRRIEAAIEQGAFDDLPGKGKPLNLGGNPFEPAGMEMANKLLKDNGMAPAWIAQRNEVLAEIEAFRTELKQTWNWHRWQMQLTRPQERQDLERSWRSYFPDWQSKIEALNKRITTANLSLPIWRMEILTLRLDDEMRHIGAPAHIPGSDETGAENP